MQKFYEVELLLIRKGYLKVNYLSLILHCRFLKVLCMNKELPGMPMITSWMQKQLHWLQYNPLESYLILFHGGVTPEVEVLLESHGLVLFATQMGMAPI